VEAYECRPWFNGRSSLTDPRLSGDGRMRSVMDTGFGFGCTCFLDRSSARMVLAASIDMPQKSGTRCMH